MILASRPWLAFSLFPVLVLVARYPHAPGHFDVRISQPQPPGYPLFVLEMRVLHWLHFRRAESILLVLALAGSIATLGLPLHAGRRIFGGLCGFLAACLLVFHPVFWHSGITSALRVQLAATSLLVAAACWPAWIGDGPWVPRSAVLLGICAGIRPEIGIVLFPLWAACALRAAISWRQRASALGAMTGPAWATSTTRRRKPRACSHRGTR